MHKTFSLVELGPVLDLYTCRKARTWRLFKPGKPVPVFAFARLPAAGSARDQVAPSISAALAGTCGIAAGSPWGTGGFAATTATCAVGECTLVSVASAATAAVTAKGRQSATSCRSCSMRLSFPLNEASASSCRWTAASRDAVAAALRSSTTFVLPLRLPTKLYSVSHSLMA